jgi:hypothetical protein
MISWQIRKQSSISLSMTKAEYIAACSTSCEAIWLRKLLTGLFDLEMEATMILCDNQSCIKMTENPVLARMNRLLMCISQPRTEYFQPCANVVVMPALS